MERVRPATIFALALGVSALIYLGWRGAPWVEASPAEPLASTAPAVAEVTPSGVHPMTCAEWQALTGGEGPAILQTVNGVPVARTYAVTCTEDEAGIRLTISGG